MLYPTVKCSVFLSWRGPDLVGLRYFDRSHQRLTPCHSALESQMDTSGNTSDPRAQMVVYFADLSDRSSGRTAHSDCSRTTASQTGRWPNWSVYTALYVESTFRSQGRRY